MSVVGGGDGGRQFVAPAGGSFGQTRHYRISPPAVSNTWWWGGTEVYGKTIADMSVFIPYMSHVWDKFLPTKVFRGGVKIISLSLYKHCN